MNVLLVETLGYNLMSIPALADMGFGTYFDKGIVVLMWSKSLKVVTRGDLDNAYNCRLGFRERLARRWKRQLGFERVGIDGVPKAGLQ